jgi:hypothetical protein
MRERIRKCSMIECESKSERREEWAMKEAKLELSHNRGPSRGIGSSNSNR